MGLALIFPMVMHVIKFLLLGALEIYTALTVSFSAHVTLYVYYGVHTIAPRHINAQALCLA